VIGLDWFAPVLHGFATVILAKHRRWGWYVKGAAAILSIIVSYLATYNGRPVWGFVALGFFNLYWSIKALALWKKEPRILDISRPEGLL